MWCARGAEKPALPSDLPQLKAALAAQELEHATALIKAAELRSKVTELEERLGLRNAGKQQLSVDTPPK